MELQQSVLQDVVSLLDDTEAMKKLQKYIRRLKSEKEAENVMTEDDKAEILNDIREGLREVKAAREGKIKLQSARGFLNEVRN